MDIDKMQTLLSQFETRISALEQSPVGPSPDLGVIISDIRSRLDALEESSLPADILVRLSALEAKKTP